MTDDQVALFAKILGGIERNLGELEKRLARIENAVVHPLVLAGDKAVRVLPHEGKTTP